MTAVFVTGESLKGQDVKWIDTRFSLQDSPQGRTDYEAGHMSGAIHWDLEEDLSDMTKPSGRHPLPDKKDLKELFRRSGLMLDDHIIVYDNGGSPFAARAWWILQYAGFNNASICLDGYEALVGAGFPADQAIPQPNRTDVEPKWQEDIFASKDFVKETVNGQTGYTMLDARSAPRYRGEIEPIDPVAGHIPGALNFDWEQLKQNGIFNLQSDVKDQLTGVVKADRPIIAYCGSGVTATPLYAMLKQNGYEDVRLYVGSYSDWITTETVDKEVK
ncbi:sulfurtransferase [Sporosarcina sp. Te-1]|uniref:sulfurtransferase n=1 Tax=Sporosarcina sp. Te-1 TaxID=2818390 RepID=UPI001A9F4D41|nr:sulfurtransferase [Sporosarcina sp. Te-1]QTD42136.1 sulfurtransferase [Sporosarcina sp. Te-1]